MGTLPWTWIVFNIIVIGMLALDLGVFHRNAHRVTFREAATWSVIWIALALVFNVGVFFWMGKTAALQFFTGYLIEKSLSVDNIFVFALIFTYFGVPQEFQHRVLFWGVLGALVMRAVLIAVGATLVQQFHWVFYVFGLLLILTSLKMLRSKGTADVDPEHNAVVRLFRRVMPVTSGYEGSRLFVRKGKTLMATPLFLVLLVVETSDLIFAVDSIPAIFAITVDPFIVYTSNVFAILGLRSLYFLLANVIDKFQYLGTGLAVVLAFIGSKMLLMDFVHIPITVSLAVIVIVISASIMYSLRVTRSKTPA